jgi:hypothetical protein
MDLSIHYNRIRICKLFNEIQEEYGIVPPRYYITLSAGPDVWVCVCSRKNLYPATATRRVDIREFDNPRELLEPLLLEAIFDPQT